MKTGISLQDLAVEIERQNNAKRDFLADTRKLQMTLEGNLALDLGEESEAFVPTDHCHNQISARLSIPKRYYDRMRKENPALLATNVNTWLQENPESRMVRTLDGKARAFLSDRYRTLDNYDLLHAALPIIRQQEDANIVSCQVTDSRLYLKCLLPRVQAEVRQGDIVQGGVVISNSEVGQGLLKVEPLIYRLVCTNGMIAQSNSDKFSRRHIGKSQVGDSDLVWEILSDDTRELTDKAFWNQVKDVLTNAFKASYFQAQVEKLRAATEKELEGNPVKAVEVVKKRYQLSDSQGESIMRHLITGGDLTQYGIANAVTRTAQDQESYDDATDLERIGGEIIVLPQNHWREIALAA